jgi:nicotinate-nucleotide adenylyltransferase
MVLAQEAAAQLGLAKVMLVPTGRAPHKEIPDDPGPEVRLEMAAAAVDGELIDVERFEVEQAGRSGEPSYTFRTLEALAADGNDDLVWIMGADAAIGLEEWRSPQRILELARVAVAERRGVERGEVEAVLARLGGEGRGTFIDMPEIGVSSTMVRERVSAARPIRYLVADRVAELIDEKGLYS